MQQLLRRRLRIGVRHIHERSHATCHSSTALRIDVSLVRQSGLTKMHMFIDDARDEVFACGIDDCSGSEICDFVSAYNLGNLAIRNEDTCHKGLAFVDKCRIFDIVIHQLFLGLILPVMPLQRRLSTPKTASRKIPLLIFDCPSRRSVKMIGTSSILKPSFQAVYFISIWKA